jgi:hypothetical protein
MKKNNTFICFFLFVSAPNTYAQDLKMLCCPDFSRSTGKHKESLLTYIHAGFQPGELHYKIKEDPAPPLSSQYVKTGDGYFKRVQTVKPKTYDTIKGKALFFVMFKPVFQIKLNRKLFVYTAPEAAIYFNAKNRHNYNLAIDCIDVSVERYDVDASVAHTTSFGVDAGLGYVFKPGTAVQISSESEVLYGQHAVGVFHESIVATLHFMIFS